jgi:glycoprotein endo-alpha-1,2-mannosidase
MTSGLITRRRFVSGTLGWLAGSLGLPRRLRARDRLALGLPVPALGWRGRSAASLAGQWPRRPLPEPPSRPIEPDLAAAGALLRARFPRLAQHFVFEYYPWYRVAPYRHWDQWDRQPPVDIASHYMPRLGPYDSRDVRVIEQHARWIADMGVGAIDVSWWGPGSDTDEVVPLLMDVMAAHGLQVTFHLEPYRDDRSARYAADILYLLRRYGEARRWDCLLLLEDARGRRGPVFKSFRTILPPTVRDCHGLVYPVPDYTPDGEWRRQTDRVRDLLAETFDYVLLLADSLDPARARAAGFDGIAIYDPYVAPATWAGHAAAASRAGLVFSFSVNPGFDGIAPRRLEPDSCYRPPRFEPEAGELDWRRAEDRERAAALGRARIRESLDTTVRLQIDPALANAQRGLFLVYVNSFNEWHEGHQFEPMKDWDSLTPEERAVGYHNPADGATRARTLATLLAPLLARRDRIGPPEPPFEPPLADRVGSAGPLTQPAPS